MLLLMYIITRENLFHLCKIGLPPYGARLISKNAGKIPYDVIQSPAGHRPML